MKKILGIFLAVAFFLILLALLAFKLFFSGTDEVVTPPQPNPFENVEIQNQQVYTDTPYRTVLTCYTWYVKVYAQDATTEQILEQPQTDQCFTAAFLDQWDDIMAESETDAVLRAQDLASSWNTINIATVGESVRTSDQEVRLGQGEEQAMLIAHLVRQDDGSWKIDSVTLP